MAEVAAEDPAFAKYLADRNQDDGRPELAPYLQFYLQSWHLLHDDRPFGAMGGVGPIPYHTISIFARDHGVAGDDLTVFRKLIKALDAEYLSWIAENRNDRTTPQPSHNG